MIVTLALGAAVVAGAAWYAYRRTRDVPCTIELEATQAHLHAHVSLHGVVVEPGDEVLVRNAPRHIPLGTVRTIDSRATVRQASWLRRQWVRLIGGTEFHELYDVGFEG